MERQTVEVTGIVLAGGGSRRMGTDKALLSLGELTVIEHVVSCVQPLVGQIIVVTNDPDSVTFLGLATTPDITPDKGPLMGLYSGLSACTTPWGLVVACDAPFLSGALLVGLLERRQDNAMVLPLTERGPQPMPGLYPTSIASTIAGLLEDGCSAMRELIAAGPVELMNMADVKRLDPEAQSFMDNDTPEDLAAARIIAKGRHRRS